MRLSFPASEIEAFSEEADELPAMTVTFMGLSGSSSVLPLHYWRLCLGANSAITTRHFATSSTCSATD